MADINIETEHCLIRFCSRLCTFAARARSKGHSRSPDTWGLPKPTKHDLAGLPTSVRDCQTRRRRGCTARPMRLARKSPSPTPRSTRCTSIGARDPTGEMRLTFITTIIRVESHLMYIIIPPQPYWIISSG